MILTEIGGIYMEEKVEYLLSLGKALYKFYGGETLTHEELSLIASSSNDDKILALNFSAPIILAKRTDRSLNHFVNNNNLLRTINLGKKRK